MNSDDIEQWAFDDSRASRELADWANKHPELFTTNAIAHLVQARAYLQVAIENASKKP